MYPKTALKILGIMIVCIAIFFGFIFIKQKLDLKLTEDSKLLETDNQKYINIIDDIVEKKNRGEELGEEEQRQLEEITKQKLEEEYQKINEKREEENREEYTQEELDFIFNPQKTTEEELGIEQEEKEESERYTQEELDAIFNP